MKKKEGKKNIIYIYLHPLIQRSMVEYIMYSSFQITYLNTKVDIYNINCTKKKEKKRIKFNNWWRSEDKILRKPR